MSLYLGIDGGGTGCRAALADAAGRVIGHGQAGPANIASDPALARDNILRAAEAAAAMAFGDDGRHRLSAVTAGLGLAGANAAGAAARLHLSLPFASLRIVTDAITAAMGALAGQDGLVAAIGTGSVYAVQRSAEIRCFGGWGLVLGDEGSGAHLGRAGLARALRAVDGLVPMTPFLQGLLDRFGGPAEVVRFAQNARAADFAELAPQIIASPDPAAQALWHEAVAGVRACLQHLQGTPPLPVVFIGGLGPSYAAHLPDMAQMPAQGTALDGALMLARGCG